MTAEPATPTSPGGCRDSWEEGGDEELIRMTSNDLLQKVTTYKIRQENESKLQVEETSSRNLLVNELVTANSGKDKGGGHHHKKKGAFAGVFVPTCENMWGVLIFLRFYYIVGHAGVGMALTAVILSFTCAFCTTSSMVATVSSGGVVSKGGPYYMISRALGPVVGCTVGVMYWMAITMLAVLETLGAVEGLLMASKEAEFPYCKQAYGSVFLLSLVMMVWAGMSFISKMGIFFVFIVFSTLFMYYFGLATAPWNEAAMANDWITGLSIDTLKTNWSPHYGEGVTFGSVLAVFFPCFTGILSGANRADVLRDPPKNLRQGTFGAIIFSLFMYSSYFILWGMVADYKYLQGIEHPDLASGSASAGSSAGRRLAGGGAGDARIVNEVVWNPFPHAAHAGIIISSLSQALQCLVVSPRLLQSIANDKILSIFNSFAPLSSKGEPVRALGATYVVAGLLVLLGQLDLVAPLLSMCFLVAYTFMNISCFTLTWLRASSWRPKGIHRRRWRLWYMGTSGTGTCVCITIMFTINAYWAMAAIFLSVLLYFYVNWKQEEKGWGSAMDGIRFQLALNSLIQLESAQHQVVNWRPQVLILYRIKLVEELNGIKHHEILRFYTMLRKSIGFCVVACVLEADSPDEHALHKANIEKDVIKSIMKEENIAGFAEVVVAPTWVEGTNYIIQLTGIGGLAPNTVLMDWPTNWKKHVSRALDFVSILRNALASEKAVLAVKGTNSMPITEVYGTIDVWWMVHDGGFLILLSWLLMNYRTWRKCHLRVFTVTENVTAEQADKAAQVLKRTLHQRRLFDVDVEVIIADDEMIEAYTFDQAERLDHRHEYLEAHKMQGKEHKETIPMEIGDLLTMEQDDTEEFGKRISNGASAKPDDEENHIRVSDVRKAALAAQPPPKTLGVPSEHGTDLGEMLTPRGEDQRGEASTALDVETVPPEEGAGGVEEGGFLPTSPLSQASKTSGGSTTHRSLLNTQYLGSHKLNSIIYSRSKRSQLVIMNMPDLRGPGNQEALEFMKYCEMVTAGLERVLYVHSTGHEVFDLA